MFAKATRKLLEVGFFARQLAVHQDPDSSEFLFNAVLGSGKNVVNTLKAAIRVRCRRKRPGDDHTLADAEAKAAFRKTYRAWRRTQGQDVLDLFDVLQELRDVEVHTIHTAGSQAAVTREKRRLRDIPLEGSYRAVYATYVAMGMMSAHETVTETTCHLVVNLATERKPKNPAAFERFGARGPIRTATIGDEYRAILQSLVDYFSLKH